MDSKKLASALIIALTALLLYAIIVSSASGLIKFAIALVILAGCGISLQSLLKIEGQTGLLLLRTQKGLAYIDRIANAAPRLWQFCADFGTVLGFGASSIFFFKKLPKKTFMFSLFALIITTQFMAPKVFQVVLALINIPMDITPISEQAGGAAALISLAVFFAMVFFGLCGVTVVGLVINTYSIAATVISSLLSVPGAKLSDAVPGASPVIPGINMPLFEGLIALAVLLFVHELSHGILSRIGKVRLQSAGLLLFGIIPVGAFIDPDEKSLLKKDVDAQTRVFSAGSASNLIMFILFFFLLTGFESISAPMLDPGVYVASMDQNSSAFLVGMRQGDRLVSIDGVPLGWDNIGEFGGYISNSTVVVLTTDKASYLLEPVETGSTGKKALGIGIQGSQSYIAGYGWLGFIKNTIGLIFVLNFLVGVINLIPLFMAFDGYRILSLHQKNQLVIKFISYSLLIMFLLNLAPWLWR